MRLDDPAFQHVLVAVSLVFCTIVLIFC